MMVEEEAKVLCRTPTHGRVWTRIAKWKYDLVRETILDALPEAGEGVEFAALPQLVRRRLGEGDIQRLGSISWYTTTVRLDLEVRGEIERVPDAKPHRLRRRKVAR